VSRYVFGRYVEGDLIPELGHTREDLLQPAIRFWPVGAYLILYAAARIPIEILAVVHGARDVPAIVNLRAE
jgi:plasmid stabilization system protein ParE